MGCVFFISHRQDDKKIADVFDRALRSWSVPASDIYYSSKIYGDQKPQPGEAIHYEICKAIAEARLFIMIYTFGSEDWTWCMHELGLALDAKIVAEGGSPERQVVIVQCTEDEPKLLRETKKVTIDTDGLREFVRLVLLEYPSKEAPYHDSLAEDVLDGYAQQLFDNLLDAIPSNNAAEYHRWDHFTLGLKAEDVRILEQLGKPRAGEADYYSKLGKLRDSATISEAFGGAMLHFGWEPVRRRYGTLAGRDDLRHEQKSFGFLIDRWKEQTEYQKKEDPHWAVELLEGMGRAVRQEASEPHAWFMKSARERRDDYFYPVVNHAKVLSDGGMEFVVFMYRIEHSAPWLNAKAVEQ